MSAVIEVEGLSKKFVLRHLQRQSYETFRELLSAKLAAFGKRSGDAPGHEEFWALRDVAFEIGAGDRLGIVGRNGAGKSTLLKILSRITEPTAGRIRIVGKIASLLEVGTGFHPELTGRENIFLNGVILGMSRAQVSRRFDEIVQFAEIENFLDTPVKRYSSGMYVRLAFAVAAHLEPEILIIDEVLAVGDIAFQRKCLARLGEVGNQGRTVIFVSHNLEAVARLCNKAILLAGGRIATQGPAAEVLDAYRKESLDPLPEFGGRRGSAERAGARITSVWCSDSTGERADRVNKMEPLAIHIEAELEPSRANGVDLTVAFGIDTDSGYRLLTCVSAWEDKTFRARGPRLAAICRLPFVPFVPGTYLITAAIMQRHDMLDHVEQCARFEVSGSGAAFFANRTPDQGHVDVPFSFEFRD